MLKVTASRLHEVLLVVTLSVLIAAFFRAGLASNQVYYIGDVGSEFLPNKAYAASVFKGGQFPLWTPYTLGGFPLCAEPQVGCFYPPNWLIWALAPASAALNVSVIIHFLFSAWAMYFVCRRCGVSGTGSLFGALVYSLNGSSIYEPAVFIHPMAWFPLLFWTTRESLESRRWWPFGLAVGAAGMMVLSGSPPMAFVLLVGLITAEVVEAIFHVRKFSTWEGVWRLLGLRLVGLAFIVLMGFGLSAVQVLPTLELVSNTPRADPGWDFIRQGSLEPGLLMRLLVTPGTEYIGLIPLGLAFLGIFAAQAEKARVLTLLLTGTLLALGEFLPLYQFLYEAVPGFDLFRVPRRFFVLAIFAIAVLSARGLDGLRRYGGKWGGTVAAPVLVALLMLDRGTMDKYHFEKTEDFSESVHSQFAEAVRAQDPFAAVLPLLQVDPFGSLKQKAEYLSYQTPLLVGVRSVLGYSALHYIPYHRLLNETVEWIENTVVIKSHELLPFFGVRYLIGRELPQEVAARAVEIVCNTDRVCLYRLEASMGAAFYSSKVYRCENSQDVMRAMKRKETTCRQTDAGDMERGRPAFIDWRDGVEVEVTQWEDSQITIPVGDGIVQRPSIIVVNGQSYPGWRAEVDGQEREVLTVNYCFLAVEVRPGEKLVRLSYRPQSVYTGALITSLSLFCCLFLMGWGRRWGS